MENGGNIISRDIKQENTAFDFHTMYITLLLLLEWCSWIIILQIHFRRNKKSYPIFFLLRTIYELNEWGYEAYICLMYLLSYRINQNTFSSRNLIVNWRVQYKSNTQFRIIISLTYTFSNHPQAFFSSLRAQLYTLFKLI
jgi:hypothetical protein